MVHIDSAVSATILEQLGTFKTSILGQVNNILPIALPVVITIAVVILGLSLFQRLTGSHH